jgi:hypothetical protein
MPPRGGDEHGHARAQAGDARREEAEPEIVREEPKDELTRSCLYRRGIEREEKRAAVNANRLNLGIRFRRSRLSKVVELNGIEPSAS